MKLIVLLPLVALPLFPAEEPIIICVTDNPLEPIPSRYSLSRGDVEQVVYDNLHVFKQETESSFLKLKERIDTLEEKQISINPRTKIAMFATVLTSLLGVASALITYFAGKTDSAS